MIEKLLAEFERGSVLTPAILARRLNTSEEMVQAMLTLLEQKGILQDYAACHPDACQGCGLNQSCSGPNSKQHLWILNK